MRTQSAAQQDSPFAVTPPIQPRMPWRVASVEPLPDFRLRVQFVDGTEGTVDLTALVHSPGAGVFASLADPASLLPGVRGAWRSDLAGSRSILPQYAMYAEIKNKNERYKQGHRTRKS